jgi:hypothetical protein
MSSAALGFDAAPVASADATTGVVASRPASSTSRRAGSLAGERREPGAGVAGAVAPVQTAPFHFADHGQPARLDLALQCGEGLDDEVELIVGERGDVDVDVVQRPHEFP